MKNICVLGSTGSVGTQALEVIRNHMEEYNVVALSANSNIDLLFKQAVEFRPNYVTVMSATGYNELKDKLANYDIRVIHGMEGLEYISSLDEVDIVLTSVVGMIGLKPTISAIRAGKAIALANKETLVVGGEIIKKEMQNSNSELIPVDSEHNAIFQCLKGERRENVKRLILTASGGPFRGYEKDALKNITPEQAIKHPRWNMGKKISIDSATLMNKALEVIEAHWLFEMDYSKIDVVVHPQSIIHSMVEYVDGSVIAQMGSTDMRHPIQYALDYPARRKPVGEYLDFKKFNSLSFEEPDTGVFECLKLGYDAGKTGGTMPAVLNAANEEAVSLFLNRKISFLEIPELIKSAMSVHHVEYDIDIDKIIEIEKITREYVNLSVK